MYATCLFCHAGLGSNEVIERFPVGRRLAFDAEKGRLWVVCRACGRWNLTPLEERWEAIEDCERRFRGTRLRTSTDQIGLAHLSEGLTLVRIGRPLRPEFAAWRYGDQFGRRRRRQIVAVGVGLTIAGVVVAGGAAAGAGVASLSWSIFNASRTIVSGLPRKVLARVPRKFGPEFLIRNEDLAGIRLENPDSGQGWRLVVGPTRVTGDAAARTLSTLLPAINRFGGTGSQVRDAVRLLEAHPTPVSYVNATIATLGRQFMVAPTSSDGTLRRLDLRQRLALEMALHEDEERRAMHGELAALEAAWREAEEVAAIADNMFLPESVSVWMRRHRRA